MTSNFIEEKNDLEFPKTAAEFKKLLLENDKSVENDSLSARECISALFDERTFTEIGAYTARRSSEFDKCLSDEFESVICGYGSVGGRLVYAFAEDMSRTKGAVSEASAEKICGIYRLAVSNGAPIIGIFNSEVILEKSSDLIKLNPEKIEHEKLVNIKKGKDECLIKLSEKIKRNGGNGILDLSINYALIGFGGDSIRISAIGMGVLIEN